MTLDEVINWYGLLKDNNNLAKNLSIVDPSLFPIEHSLTSKTPDEANLLFSSANNELDDLVILSLFSIFEQIIIDYLLNTTKTSVKNARKLFNKEVLKHSFKEADRWKFKEILNLFKPVVDIGVISEIKQVYDYRNWVGHGKKKIKPLNLDPITVHQRLQRFLSQAQL